MKYETKIDIVSTDGIIKYDNCAKKIFSNKEIMAVILKNVVNEYKELSLSEIENIIDADTISSEDCLLDVNEVKIKGIGTEMSDITEKLIRYDLHFKSRIPKSKKHLHIDFEIQNETNPNTLNYDIEDRAIYYAAREISSQLSTVTKNTNYGKLEKVYTIWVCNNNVPAKKQHTIVRLSYKNSKISNLIQGIIIYRGKKQYNDTGEYDELFEFLDGIFKNDIAIIEKYVTNCNEKIRKDITEMDGLAQTIREKSKIEILIELVNEKHITEEIACEKLNVSKEEFKNLMETSK